MDFGLKRAKARFTSSDPDEGETDKVGVEVALGRCSPWRIECLVSLRSFVHSLISMFSFPLADIAYSYPMFSASHADCFLTGSTWIALDPTMGHDGPPWRRALH